MSRTWYILKYDGHYIRDVDNEYSKTQSRMSMTDNIHDAKLMDDKMRKNWVFSFALTSDLDLDKLECIKVDVSSAIVDESETDKFGIRFANGTYLTNIKPDGICTTKTEMSESESLDVADLNDKKHAETLASTFKEMSDNDVLSDSLQGEITIVPIKRTYENIKKI